MTGVHLAIDQPSPAGRAALLSLSRGQDHVAELTGVTDLGQGLNAIRIDGDCRNIKRFGAYILNRLYAGKG
jgi:hypothetical protein